MSDKSITNIILAKIIGIIFFLIIIAILSGMESNIPYPEYADGVDFLQNNAFLLIGITVLFLISDILWTLRFPSNIPAPLINGISSVLILIFIFRFVDFIDLIAGTSFLNYIEILSIYLYIFIPLFTILGGFIYLFSKRLEEEENVKKEEKDWGNIKSKFQQMIFDGIASYSKAYKKQQEKKKSTQNNILSDEPLIGSKNSEDFSEKKSEESSDTKEDIEKINENSDEEKVEKDDDWFKKLDKDIESKKVAAFGDTKDNVDNLEKSSEDENQLENENEQDNNSEDDSKNGEVDDKKSS